MVGVKVERVGLAWRGDGCREAMGMEWIMGMQDGLESAGCNHYVQLGSLSF